MCATVGFKLTVAFYFRHMIPHYFSTDKTIFATSIVTTTQLQHNALILV